MAKLSPEGRKKGLTKDNRCRVCGEVLNQPARGRLRLTCSNACRQAHHRFTQGKPSRKYKRRKKLVEARRAKPFIERTFSKTYFEPVFVLSDRRKLYECM